MPIDGTAGTFLRKIRRTVKGLSQKDIPEHKATGRPMGTEEHLKELVQTIHYSAKFPSKETAIASAARWEALSRGWKISFPA